MKVQHKNKSHKKALLIVIAAILLLLVIAWYLIIYGGSLFGWQVFPASTSVDTSAETTKAVTEAQQQNGQTIKDNSLQSGTSGSDQPTTPTPIPDSSKKKVTMSFTTLSQNGSTLKVGILIQALVATGTCTLTLTSPGKTTITQTSDVYATSNTSACDGFDVPNIATGTWQVTATYDNTDLTGTVTQSKVIQ